MQISSLEIKNFKSIQNVTISNIESACIIVGKNGTGKTVILDAILAAVGTYPLSKNDFNDKCKSIELTLILEINDEDMELFYKQGIVSVEKNFDAWKQEFIDKLPCYREGILTYTYIVELNGESRFYDGVHSHNPYIKDILPKIYYIDHNRNLSEIEDDIFYAQSSDVFQALRKNICMLDARKVCNNCFECMEQIENKKPEELTVFETTKLLEYKVYHLNMDTFINKLNYYFSKNSTSAQQIGYEIDFHVEELLKLKTFVYNHNNEVAGSIETMSAGTKSIYILSLLETYVSERNRLPYIIMMEDPEIYLHPQLQKVASEILFRLSKKNQVIFSTHSPNLLFNFNSRQIKQTILDKNYQTMINENADIDEILNDLGYSANDLMNVSFVFIVEGRQDSNRLPLLLNQYYSEIYDDSGRLQRIAIIPTNSCTNIKTYANLKYINKLYLKDQFMMIRDGDGLDPNELKRKLCSYYYKRKNEDVHNLPRVMPRNVLILKYYSFENYFLDPAVMVKLGVLKKEEDFYQILFDKYKEYLHRLTSAKRLVEETGIEIKTVDDIKGYIEEIKIYIRGHNLFDIFYSTFRGENERYLLEEYIRLAPRETFADILDAIDNFIYFESRKR